MRLNHESINFPPTNFSFHHQIVPGRSYSPSLEKPHNKPWTRRSYRRRILGRYLGVSHRRGNYRLLPSGSSFSLSLDLVENDAPNVRHFVFTFFAALLWQSFPCLSARFLLFPRSVSFHWWLRARTKIFFFVVISAKDPAEVQKHRPLLIVPKIIF